MLSTLSSTTTITTATAVTADEGGATTINAIHSDIIQSNILTKLDGPSLACVSCASSHLNSLANDDHLWKDLCNSTWPSTTNDLVARAISSFSSGHRSFFSDSFPAVSHFSRRLRRSYKTPQSTTELISAVDIHHQNQLILSKVKVTETTTNSFKSSPFWIELLDRKEKSSILLSLLKLFNKDKETLREIEDSLSLSWILIDPVRKRAINISSRMPISVKRHWLTGDIIAKYATYSITSEEPSESLLCKIQVTFVEKEGSGVQMNEVSMRVEDMDGKVVGGKKALVILLDAMDGERTKRMSRDEVRERYEKHKSVKREKTKRKRRKQERLDVVCTIAFTGMMCMAMPFIFLLSLWHFLLSFRF